MAKKSFLGIDIGHDQLKLAWVKNGLVKTTVAVQIPDNIKNNGKSLINEATASLLKKTILENGIREKQAALVLPSDDSYARNITMPVMTASQLQINLPYEFRDYFTEDLHEYLFDYAMYHAEADDGDGQEENMSLLGVAVHKNTISEAKKILAKAGLKAGIIAPSIGVYLNIIGNAEKHGADKEEEYCFIDMGNKAIRMHIFKGRRYVASKELERGIEAIDWAVAKTFDVDLHTAHEYLLSDYQNCQEGTICMDAYGTIGIDILRALNFYQFSNPDSRLNNIYICGGGANINPLMRVIESIISEYEIHLASELVNGAGDAYQQLLAIAVTME